jgi:hypothetical protein
VKLCLADLHFRLVPKDSTRRNDTRRMNKDRRARLEELRKQQRAAERRKNFLFAGAAILIALGLIAAAVIPAYLNDQAKAAKKKTGYQASPTKAEKAAGCLGVHNDPLSPAAQHLTTSIDYSKEKFGDTRGGTPAIPPTGGKHNPNTLNDQQRFYPLAQQPRPERAVHELEHGYVVVWYDSKLPADQVAKLQGLATQGNLDHLLVVGWWQGDLPLGKHVVLTSWGRTDRCATVSDSVVSSFYQAHLNASIAPEVGASMTGDYQLPANELTPPSASPSASPSPSSTKK